MQYRLYTKQYKHMTHYKYLGSVTIDLLRGEWTDWTQVKYALAAMNARRWCLVIPEVGSAHEVEFDG